VLPVLPRTATTSTAPSNTQAGWAPSPCSPTAPPSASTSSTPSPKPPASAPSWPGCGRSGSRPSWPWPPVAVLAEQRSRPHKTPWYPWVLTALAAGSSIALNFGHPYIPLDPPPRLLVACVYGVPPITAPFAWHLFLLRLAHRRHQDSGQDHYDTGQHAQDVGQDPGVPADVEGEPDVVADAASAKPVSNGQDSEPSRALVRVLLADETQDRPVSWQDVADQTGLSRSRAYALLREERARAAAGNGHQRPPSTPPTGRPDHPART
jgi:hypothetical protein